MKTFIHDEFEPEVIAMLQAFYSRSSESIESRLARLGNSNDKIKEALKKYYIGYGHESIGECGGATIFIEGVSLLAAKAIQNFSLYQGQECSTRYIDFGQQAMIDPLKADARLTRIQQDWLDFYVELLPQVLSLVRELHPDDGSSAWENATKAYTFDICRAFLPIGITTNLSWKTDLRKARSRLFDLKAHPCVELRNFAQGCLRQLYQKYPSSFTEDDDLFDEVDDYKDVYCDLYHYDTRQLTIDDVPSFGSDWHGHVYLKYLTEVLSFLHTRPRKVEVPQSLGWVGSFNFQFKIDYGSFRDLQRHRSAYIPQPRVGNGRSEFNSWYLETLNQLSPDLYQKATAFITKQFDALNTIKESGRHDVHELQYYYPLGTNVPVSMYASLPSAIYIAQLRCSPTVHPTMRDIALQINAAILELDPNIKTYANLEESKFSLRRGDQTIKEKSVLPESVRSLSLDLP